MIVIWSGCRAVKYFRSYVEKKEFYTSSKYQWWVVVVQCEKFLLSIITSKVLHLQRSATSLFEDHGKIFPKCTYFLPFQLWEPEIWLLVVGLKSIWENFHFCASFIRTASHKSAICSESINHRSLGLCSFDFPHNFLSIWPIYINTNFYLDAKMA